MQRPIFKELDEPTLEVLVAEAGLLSDARQMNEHVIRNVPPEGPILLDGSADGIRDSLVRLPCWTRGEAFTPQLLADGGLCIVSVLCCCEDNIVWHGVYVRTLAHVSARPPHVGGGERVPHPCQGIATLAVVECLEVASIFLGEGLLDADALFEVGLPVLHVLVFTFIFTLGQAGKLGFEIVDDSLFLALLVG